MELAILGALHRLTVFVALAHYGLLIQCPSGQDLETLTSMNQRVFMCSSVVVVTTWCKHRYTT